VGVVTPDAARRLRAIGPIEELPTRLQRAFTPGSDFDPIPEPGPGDWLNVAHEKGQAFERFAQTTARNPSESPQCIYLKPVGEDFPQAHSRLLQQLQRFGTAFFAQEVRVLPPLAVEGTGITMRQNRFTDVVQLKTRDILPALARDIPADASCVLGLTAYDLYPHDTWSFVFGEALLGDRVGVFSIARYDPAFYDKPADDRPLLLRRSCKVLAHETCHMFGIQHCVFFNCLMNGSNHLEESDRRPLHLCPVDLRKLQWSLAFDVADRYRQLLSFWRDAGVDDEAEWLRRRIEFIERG
jgi:archaemetzincin